MFVGLIGLAFGNEPDLPFDAPKSFVTSPTGMGDEGSRLGEITNEDRDFKITYSVGGQFARRTKRPVSQDDSVDAMFYYHETEIDGIDVQIVGYRVRGDENSFRIMVWVPELETHFSVYVTGRAQVAIALNDFERFKLKNTKRESGPRD